MYKKFLTPEVGVKGCPGMDPLSRMVKPLEKNLLFIDFETTGLDPKMNAPIDMGCILLRGSDLQFIGEWSAHIKPWEGAVWTQKAYQYHKVSEGLASQRGIDFGEAVEEFFKDFGTEHYIFAGWNVAFDVRFLKDLCERAWREEDFEKIDYHTFEMSSVAYAAYMMGIVNSYPKGLHQLASTLGMESAGAHSAVYDAKLTASVLRVLMGMDPLPEVLKGATMVM